uniref:Uncharacterized protein n=1 Tax=Timema cristinae TaxID=61476 RepID=A0A7R9DBM5_TIMCR|nr:unnamed protein product [Timema cristinae]
MPRIQRYKKNTTGLQYKCNNCQKADEREQGEIKELRQKTRQSLYVHKARGFDSNTGDTTRYLMPPWGPMQDFALGRLGLTWFNWCAESICIGSRQTTSMVLYKVWKTLEADELFHTPQLTPVSDEQKRRAALQLIRYHQYKFYTEGTANNNYKRKTRTILTLNEAIAGVNMNLSVKFALGVSLFSNTILSLGTERHHHFSRAAWNGELLSAVALTEVGHGSNTKQLRTTATYDPSSQQFVINTPDFQAAKCWIGNLGKTCTYALVFAQLITVDGSHGLHAFVVPIRDPTTFLPYPGLILGDIGDKAGLNGIDNGFIMFQNYRIPRENLLNRTSDVTAEGDYETSFSNPEQQLGAALENLSAGRVGIMQESVATLASAITIAIRYSAVRRQFGPDPDGEELPIIEYEMQQWRLFPYVAAACALRIFIESFIDQYLECVEMSHSGAKLAHLDVQDMVKQDPAKATAHPWPNPNKACW